MARTLSELDRNDVPGAIAVVEQLLDAGTYSTDDGEIVSMLQDDPEYFLAEYAKMMQRRSSQGRAVEVQRPGASAA